MSLSLSDAYANRAQSRELRLYGTSDACHHTSTPPVPCTPLCAWMRLLRPALRIESTMEKYQSAYSPFKTRFRAIRVSSKYATTQAHLEALELFLLALQLNPEATWRDAMADTSAVPGLDVKWLGPFDTIEPHVHFEIGEMDQWCLGKGKRKGILQLLRMKFARSVQYRLTRRWLVKRYAQHARSLEGYTVPLTVSLLKWTEVSRISADIARVIAQISKSLSRSPYSPLHLESVELPWRTELVTTAPLYRLKYVTNLAVHVNVMYPGPEGMFQAFANERITIDTCVIGRPATFSLNMSKWPMLRTRGGIREIHIDAKCLENEDNLRDVAIVLLAPSAPSPVEHIELCGYPATAHVQSLVDAVRASQSPSRYTTRRNRLKSLTLRLRMSQGDFEAYAALLELIGANIEAVKLVSDGWWASNSFVLLGDSEILSLLAACPSLRCLSVHFARMFSIKSLVNAYDLGLGERLESLVLECDFQGDDAGMVALLQASNDPSSAVHRTLRDLEYKSLARFRQVPDAQVTAEMMAEIKRNTTLRHIGVLLTKDEASRHGGMIDGLDGELMAQTGASVELVTRLALLSVLRGRLPSDACHIVMEFCGEAIRRRAYYL